MNHRLAALSAVLLLLAACDGPYSGLAPDFNASPAASFAVTPAAVSLERGASLRLSISLNGNDARGLNAQATQWTTSDERVATVAAGMVHAHAAGTATITARVGRNVASALFTVEPAPAIILMIGDGMGTGALAAARLRLQGPLSMDALPVHGWQETASADRDITDSAAGATALATGVRTNYTYLSVAPDGVTRLETLLEAAELRGMASGLIATSSVTHATPAAFAAHLTGRGDQLEIARQMSLSGVDVLLGGGQKWFGAQLRANFSARGCMIVENAVAFNAAQGPCLIGLFGQDSMPRLVLDAAPRAPSLAEMARKAIALLDQDEDGFFLMVEGSMIDWAGHSNHGEWLIAETLDFDRAVQAVIEAVGDRGNTLIVVTADHETGGLTVVPRGPSSLLFDWTTFGHTAVNVPVFARGPGSFQLQGTRRNDEIGRILRSRFSNFPAVSE